MTAENAPNSAQRGLSDVEAFCTALRPGEDLCYLEHCFNDELLPLARRHNVLALPIPVQYGGRGLGAVDYARALARIGREGVGVRTFFSGHTSIGQLPILRWGNEHQRQCYLPAAARGEIILAFGLTEPDAGSNPLELKSTYRRDAGGYRLNGVKYLISNGGIADVVVTLAYPEGDAPGRRMSAFLVETAGETFQREDLTAKVGMPTANTGMFEMIDHPVAAENMLGPEGEGFRIAMDTLVSGRLSVAAGCLGLIEDCLVECLAYSQERSQHGKPIGKHQLVQEHLAAIEMARFTTAAVVDEAARAKEASDADRENKTLAAEADLRVAQAKLYASNAACDAADRGVQIFGGRGWSTLYRVGRHWQDARVCRLYEGTDEVLKLKIAAALLGRDFAAFR